MAANFYPTLGAYSSRNRTVVEEHMQQMRQVGIGVLVLSWYPAGRADENAAGTTPDALVRMIMDCAAQAAIQVRVPECGQLVGAMSKQPSLGRLRSTLSR